MVTHTSDHEETRKIFYVVDPNPSLRQRIVDLLTSKNVIVKSFADAEDFLATPPPYMPGCLIVGADLIGMRTVDLIQELKNQQVNLPLIVLGNENDIPQAVSMMRAGSMVIDIHTLNGDTSKGFSATLRGGGNYDFGSFSFQDSFDLPNDRSLYLYGAIGLIDGVSSDDFRSPICD